MSFYDEPTGDDAWLDWAEWWRVPRVLPEVDRPPSVCPGERHVVHHVDDQTVASYDPARGTATPAWRLTEHVRSADPRVHGRYLPVRSGILAYYRDEAGRVVVQHRRRRVVVSPGMRCSDRFLWAVRRLKFHDESGRVLVRIHLIDAPGRWLGPAILRFFDFTFFIYEDYDLTAAIAVDLADGTPRLV